MAKRIGRPNLTLGDIWLGTTLGREVLDKYRNSAKDHYSELKVLIQDWATEEFGGIRFWSEDGKMCCEFTGADDGSPTEVLVKEKGYAPPSIETKEGDKYTFLWRGGDSVMPFESLVRLEWLVISADESDCIVHFRLSSHPQLMHMAPLMWSRVWREEAEVESLLNKLEQLLVNAAHLCDVRAADCYGDVKWSPLEEVKSMSRVGLGRKILT